MDMGDSHIIYRLPMPAAPGVPISEFNHHLAGLVVFIVGLAAMLMYVRPRSATQMRYVWPSALLFLGIYLILYGNPSGWPAARNVGLLDSVTHDRSAMQHMIFAVLLVIMGSLELARATRALRGSGWRWGFPALATLGALYLIFHEHSGAEHMSMPQMEQEMAGIRLQHMIYLGLGVGIALSKVFNDLRIFQSRWLPYVWPSLTMLLGIALMFYRE